MALELKDFTALKEIQSLDNMIKKHLDAIKNEESRKDHVLELREKKESEKVGLLNKLDENRALISELEKELFDWEKKREQAETNQSKAFDQKQAEALAKEIGQITPKCEECEEKILSLLEENEGIEIKISEADQFLAGSLETLEEISNEIYEETVEERKQINNYESRVRVLLEEIPKDLHDEFLRVREKYRFNLPLARIVNKACEKCRFQVDSQTLSLVDQARLITRCHQCERLLIPFDA